MSIFSNMEKKMDNFYSHFYLVDIFIDDFLISGNLFVDFSKSGQISGQI